MAHRLNAQTTAALKMIATVVPEKPVWYDNDLISTLSQRSRWENIPRLKLVLNSLVAIGYLKTNYSGHITGVRQFADSNGAETDVMADPRVQKLLEKVASGESSLESCKTEIANLKQQLTQLESQKTLEVVLTDGKRVKVNGKQHKCFVQVLKLCNARLNVLLVGPAGTGKSYLAAQIAKTLKLEFAHISCSAGMSEGTLLGRLLPTGKGGQFQYSISEFVRLYEKGGVFLIDEMDAADSNVMIVINSALANGHMSVPNRIDKPTATRHKDFICIAAANTYGTGADRMYVGRNQLDEATLDRFRCSQVTMDYDPDVERQVCPDDELRERFLRYRRNIRSANLRRLVSMRAMEQAYVAKQAGISDAEIDQSLFSGWSQDEVRRVQCA